MVSLKSGIYLILLSIFASFILVVLTDLNKYELGALMILLMPFINGFVGIAIYSTITFVSKNSWIRIIALLIIVLYNLYFGIAFHFNWTTSFLLL
jgi:hypothetical protein